MRIRFTRNENGRRTTEKKISIELASGFGV